MNSLLRVSIIYSILGLLCLHFISCTQTIMPDSRKKSSSIIPYLIGIGGANTADLISTKQAIDSGKLHESNPLLGSNFKDIAVRKSIISGTGALSTALLNHNHPKLAKTLAVAEMVVPSIAAYHNWRKLHQLQP